MDREDIVFSLIDGLYEAAADPSRWPQFLDHFAHFFESTGIALFVQDFNEGLASCSNLGFAATARIDPSYLQSFDEHYGAVNVWIEKAQKMAPGVVVSDLALFPRHRLVKTEWYTGWLKPQDYGASMGVTLAKADGLAVNMTLLRSFRSGDYSEEELRTFQSFTPHLRRAIALHAKLSEFERWKDGSNAILERLFFGVVLLDGNARVVFANRAARETMAAGRAIRSERDGRIGAVRTKDAWRLQAAINTAVDLRMQAAQAPFRIRLAAGPSSWVDVSVLPLPRSADGPTGLLFGKGPVAALFVTDPDRQIDLPCAALIEQYGFTGAEASLAQALVRGSTLNQYAEARGITRNTVMTQLKGVMAKTNTKRQVEVVSTILTGPVALLLEGTGDS